MLSNTRIIQDQTKLEVAMLGTTDNNNVLTEPIVRQNRTICSKQHSFLEISQFCTIFLMEKLETKDFSQGKHLQSSFEMLGMFMFQNEMFLIEKCQKCLLSVISELTSSFKRFYI